MYSEARTGPRTEGKENIFWLGVTQTLCQLNTVTGLPWWRRG